MPLVESRPGRPVLIRITPLIDVVFILLIFFMLTSRLTPVGALEVSSGSASGSEGNGERVPTLHLKAPEGLLWSGESLSRQEILARIDRARPETVIVSTDAGTTLTRFTQWQGLLAERGIIGQWRKGRSTPSGSADEETRPVP